VPELIEAAVADAVAIDAAVAGASATHPGPLQTGAPSPAAAEPEVNAKPTKARLQAGSEPSQTLQKRAIR